MAALEPHPRLLALAKTGELPSGTFIDADLVASAHVQRISALTLDAALSQGLVGDDEAMQLLGSRALRGARRVNLARRALVEVLETFDGDVRVGVAKGLVIGSLLYDRPELRQSADVDLFFHPEDHHRFGELLHMLDQSGPSPHLLNAAAASGRSFEYPAKVGDVYFDLHTDIMNLVQPMLQTELFWSRLTETRFPDDSSPHTVFQLDDELRLILLMLNHVRDVFPDLRHLNDLRLMLDRDIDWDFVESFITEEGWYDAVASGLGIVCGYLERPVPLPIKSRSAHFLADRLLWPRRLRLRGKLRGPLRTSQTRVSLLTHGRRRELLKLIWRKVVPRHEMLEFFGYGSRGPRLWRIAKYRLNQARFLRTLRSEAREA